MPTVKNNPLYPNLEAELMRCGITKVELARELGLGRRALYLRLTGDVEFSVNEVRMICAYIERRSGRPMTLKYLFNI